MKWIAVVDGGSTKTDWAFLSEDGKEINLQTIGMNPYFTDRETIQDCLEKEIYPFVNPQLFDEVLFFGSGCAKAGARKELQDCLEEFFDKAFVTVDGDLKGSALAMLGDDKSGIVGILGTGSSSCLYSNGKIVQQQPSLGYILGDEGSAAAIGRILLGDYLNGKMPEYLRQKMSGCRQLSEAEILHRIYKENFPNVFLASLLKDFEGLEKDDPYLNGIIEGQIRLFFENQLLKYKEEEPSPIYMSGSLAFYFQHIIKKVAGQYDRVIGGIQRHPIEGLRQYIRKYKFI